MTLSQRVAVGLATGAAAVALSFAASPASADDWHLAGGFGDLETCEAEGHAYIYEEDNHNYTEYECMPVGGFDDPSWQVWVR